MLVTVILVFEHLAYAYMESNMDPQTFIPELLF
jgi:hypothetical protein